MAKPTAQQCHAMTSYYIGRYEKVKGTKPVVNRNKAKYTFESLLWDYSVDEVKGFLDFFIDHYDQTLEWFNYNYETVINEHNDYGIQQELAAKRRRDTAERLEAWRKRKEQWKKS